jgi:hypothetical protein
MKQNKNIAAMIVTEVIGKEIHMTDINTGVAYSVTVTDAVAEMLEPEVIVAFDLKKGQFINEVDDQYMWG